MQLNSSIVKFTLSLFVLFFALWCLRRIDPATPSTTPVLEIHGKTMGTTYKVVLADLGGDLTLKTLQQQVDKRLHQINQVMSTYIVDSELSQFNQSKSTDWITVSEELFQLIRRAHKISDATNGAFDITVGPAVNLWQFGPRDIPQERTLPEQAAIDSVKEKIGYLHLHIDDQRQSLRKDFPELYIDLSAIAKGYAVDEILALLKKHPIGNGCLVEIGGEIGTHGIRADETSWKIGIQQPDAAPGTLSARINLSSGAMATSGDYFNFFEVDGARYSHTINPLTAKPVMHELTSVVVITKNCADADAWATALLVLGPVEAYDIAKQHDLAVMLFERTDSGITSQQTPTFEQVVVKD
tara:strand:- start:1878 stop:2942 length:1065 start_codon:yes stop_codon:yes gene_type:complete